MSIIGYIGLALVTLGTILYIIGYIYEGKELRRKRWMPRYVNL